MANAKTIFLFFIRFMFKTMQRYKILLNYCFSILENFANYIDFYLLTLKETLQIVHHLIHILCHLIEIGIEDSLTLVSGLEVVELG